MFVLSVEHDLLVAAISIARRKTCIFVSKVNVLNAIHKNGIQKIKKKREYLSTTHILTHSVVVSFLRYPV